MKIEIFKGITTEGVITSIEENSKKYHEGFFADMSNAPERKLVKESSADIKGIVKELETAKVKINKANTLKVNAECKAIVDRLEVANAPFTVLENEWKALRAKELFDEKEVVRLRAAMIQKQDDHEIALLINKTFEFDKAEQLRVDEEMRHNLKLNAEREALDRQTELNAKLKQHEINAENARLTDVEHVRYINVLILTAMINHGLPEAESKDFIKTLAKKQLPQISINY